MQILDNRQKWISSRQRLESIPESNQGLVPDLLRRDIVQLPVQLLHPFAEWLGDVNLTLEILQAG
jgi:hypothetical protein